MTEPVNSMFNAEYSLIRLVYINSANHAYSEIMLDSHMAMFGNNNVGKTASLAGTKILLFPEVNFYKCESKFGFKGEAGLYSMEDSYEFYFPDRRSFIVLEVENPEGRFCMVLYRTTNFGYGRFFIPVEYEKLRSIFWNVDTNYFSDNLDIIHLNSFSKQNDGVQITDRKEIAELVFSGYRGTPSKQRFCIVPLKDDKAESITAFCNIYQLAFESNELEEKSLPNAISTLLEMSRSRDKERLDANLSQLSEEHSQLHKKGEFLQKIANASSIFASVKSNFDQSKQSSNRYSEKWWGLKNALDNAKRDHAEKNSELLPPHTAHKQELGRLNEELKTLIKAMQTHEGTITSLTKAVVKKESALNSAKKLRSTYAGMEQLEILAILQEDIDKYTSNLRAYHEQDGVQKKLSENITKQNRLKSEVSNLDELITKSDSSLLFQLNDSTAVSTLYSINKAFADVISDLSDEHKTTIGKFTQLFSTNESGHIFFLEKLFGSEKFQQYDATAQRKHHVLSKSNKETQLLHLSDEIQGQHEALKHKNIETLITSTKKELNDSNADFAAISGIASLEKDLESLQLELAEETIIDGQNKENHNQLVILQNEAKGEFDRLDVQMFRLIKQKESFDPIEHALTMASNIIKPSHVVVAPISSDKLSTDYAREIASTATACASSYNQFKDSFRSLVNDLPHEEIDIHLERHDLVDYDHSMHIYTSAFQTLEYDMQQYQTAVRSHNQYLNNQLNELNEASSYLSNFIKELNQEMNSKTVSNLTEIVLHVEINPAYQSLLSKIDNLNIAEDSLMEYSFYESVSNFVEKYFDKGTRRLRMTDIISSISYRYKLQGTDEVVTKSQSGGTTSAITAFVLAILFKRVTPDYISLRLPIIVDEISVLDSNNTDSTIQQISEHGFSIFCATPSFSALVSQKVGRWIMIDKWMIGKPLVAKCHINVLPQHVDSFGVN